MQNFNSKFKIIFTLTVFLFFGFSFFMLSARGANVQVVITEIMYDLPTPGSDSGREWIEIYNEGATDIDLTTWKFYEDGTNHGIYEGEGGSILGPGEYAVIADNISSQGFKGDWPNYTGILFDSSFSRSEEHTSELQSH